MAVSGQFLVAADSQAAARQGHFITLGADSARKPDAVSERAIIGEAQSSSVASITM